MSVGRTVCLMISIMRMGSGFRSMSEAEASEEGDGTTQGER